MAFLWSGLIDDSGGEEKILYCVIPRFVPSL